VQNSGIALAKLKF